MTKIILWSLLFIGIIFLDSCNVKQHPPTLTSADSLLFDIAGKNALLAREGYQRCMRYTLAWLEYADPVSGLIPRNLNADKDIWNGHDAGADNYPFMVLTASFMDTALMNGRLLEILHQERRLATRINFLPEPYSFSKKDFVDAVPDTGMLVFGGSEYVKDGLMPLTEWLGHSPWSGRMIEVVSGIGKISHVAGKDNGGYISGVRIEEVNGEMLQTLSRLYWMTGEQRYLDWATEIAHVYLKGNRHPTRNLPQLRLRDHGSEIMGGLSEYYAAIHYARPDSIEQYKEPLYAALDAILNKGRNEDGMFYNAIDPLTSQVLDSGIADTWGYILNAYLTVDLLDHVPRYREAVLKIFGSLNEHYRNFDWEHGSSDGYADAIESAINLYNRIPDERVAAWIDSEMQVMWAMQKPSGIIEGWHGDGNFARTTIMYNLLKTQGTRLSPGKGARIGAVVNAQKLYIIAAADSAWSGKLVFDQARHRQIMHLPIDYPRINQFQEWFTADPKIQYVVHQYKIGDAETQVYDGGELIKGISLQLEPHKPVRMVVERAD